MKIKSPAVILSVVIVLAAVVMPTLARVRGRKNCGSKGRKGTGCNSNVSLFKRLLEEKSGALQGEQDQETRGDDSLLQLLVRDLLLDEKDRDENYGETENELAPETRAETDELKEKMLLLRDLLVELDETFETEDDDNNF